MGEGAVGYRGATFERRLATLISMTDCLRRPSLLALVAPLADRLFEEWRTEPVQITEGVEILRAFDRAAWSPLARMTDLHSAIRDAMIAEASTGCRSDELRELLSVLDLDEEMNGDVLAALRQGFEVYRRRYFDNEIRECQSTEQFDGLLEDLELFKSTLSVDTNREVTKTEEAKADFEEHQNAYAHMEDEWKERWRNERASEATVRDMFGSLRSDRD
jgi:hypothetical protein